MDTNVRRTAEGLSLIFLLAHGFECWDDKANIGVPLSGEHL